MALKDALAVLRKEMKEALEFDENLVGITTGSIAVDYITGIGGFPRGRLSEVFGWESSGKTTLCLSACANAQRKGFTAAYLDLERAVSLSHATNIGFDYKDETKGAYVTPTNFEEASRAVEILAEGNIDLICVDSVPAMTPKAFMEGDIDDQGRIGLQSQLMAKFLSRITKTIAQHNNALVMVNQMRAKINTGPGAQWEPKEQSAGGSALKFYGSLRIDLDRIKSYTDDEKSLFTGKEIKVAYAGLHRAHAFKNKVAVPYRQCEFTIKYGKDGIYGIDNLETIIQFAKNKGVIEMSSSGHYKYNGAKYQFAGRGTDELYRFLSLPEQMETRKEIRASAGI
jgi:recombination protein RecA